MADLPQIQYPRFSPLVCQQYVVQWKERICIVPEISIGLCPVTAVNNITLFIFCRLISMHRNADHLFALISTFTGAKVNNALTKAGLALMMHKGCCRTPFYFPLPLRWTFVRRPCHWNPSEHFNFFCPENMAQQSSLPCLSSRGQNLFWLSCFLLGPENREGRKEGKKERPIETADERGSSRKHRPSPPLSMHSAKRVIISLVHSTARNSWSDPYRGA